MSTEDAVREVQQYVNSIRPPHPRSNAKRFYTFTHAGTGKRIRINLKTGKVVALA